MDSLALIKLSKTILFCYIFGAVLEFSHYSTPLTVFKKHANFHETLKLLILLGPLETLVNFLMAYYCLKEFSMISEFLAIVLEPSFLVLAA